MAYWLLAVALVLGVVAVFSIGAPFLLLGLALLVLGPLRSNRAVFWPAIAGALGFICAFVLVTPLGCSSTVSPTAGQTRTALQAAQRVECGNIMGIEYSGTGDYRAPLLPALVAGLAGAGAAAAVVRRATVARS
jgi:hypothetical protein